MDQKFDYKLQKSTLSTFTMWQAGRKKWVNKWGIIK